MKPVDFEGKNCTYTKEGCKDLPAYKIDDVIITCWEMSEEEKELFQETGRIYLCCHGSQPPVVLTVDKPYEPKNK